MFPTHGMQIWNYSLLETESLDYMYGKETSIELEDGYKDRIMRDSHIHVNLL